jgi:hypothetical protein
MDLLWDLDSTKDVFPLKNGNFFVNNRGFEGTVIDASRLTKYAQASQGNFPMLEFHQKRQEYFDDASLCYVQEEKVLDGET